MTSVQTWFLVGAARRGIDARSPALYYDNAQPLVLWTGIPLTTVDKASLHRMSYGYGDNIGMRG